ncbi:MAG: hypothetical protein HPY90_07850 [Syntrophothermus sp.]|nr:hypothetical protein [Syntrophothermus sp.]
MYSLRKQGYTLQAIACTLNAELCPSIFASTPLILQGVII